jgi:hypothetical protein
MPIPPSVQSLLDLFTASLADVRFGDVDAQSLARFAADMESAASTVATTQAALDAARATLQERHDALVQHAQRALAYARVYAESDPALGAQLDAISLPRSSRRPRDADVPEIDAAPRPRGRPRKTSLEPATIDATAE